MSVELLLYSCPLLPPPLLLLLTREHLPAADDVTGSHINTYEGTHGNVWAGTGGSGAGTYLWAMREFARCASVTPEPAGYCHGAISSADRLANHDVCTNGATENIGPSVVLEQSRFVRFFVY